MKPALFSVLCDIKEKTGTIHVFILLHNFFFVFLFCFLGQMFSIHLRWKLLIVLILFNFRLVSFLFFVAEVKKLFLKLFLWQLFILSILLLVLSIRNGQEEAPEDPQLMRLDNMLVSF